MLNVPATVPIFLCTQPTDMRKGFDGLSVSAHHRHGRAAGAMASLGPVCDSTF